MNILRLAFQSLCGAIAISSVALCAQAVPAAQSTDTAKEHVLLVMTDGLPWQEVFRGADPALLTKANNNDQPVHALAQLYLRPTPEERRAALMPFLWSHIVPEGEIYGNRDKGSEAYVTNGLNFSYPGYNETLTGTLTRASRAMTTSPIPTSQCSNGSTASGRPATLRPKTRRRRLAHGTRSME